MENMITAFDDLARTYTMSGEPRKEPVYDNNRSSELKARIKKILAKHGGKVTAKPKKG